METLLNRHSKVSKRKLINNIRMHLIGEENSLQIHILMLDLLTINLLLLLIKMIIKNNMHNKSINWNSRKCNNNNRFHNNFKNLEEVLDGKQIMILTNSHSKHSNHNHNHNHSQYSHSPIHSHSNSNSSSSSSNNNYNSSNLRNRIYQIEITSLLKAISRHSNKTTLIITLNNLVKNLRNRKIVSGTCKMKVIIQVIQIIMTKETS